MSNTNNDSNQSVNISDGKAGYSEFLKYLKNGNTKKAFRIKDKLVPKTLFKFIGLYDLPECLKCKTTEQCYCTQCRTYEECSLFKNNISKIEALKKNNLYLSGINALNDPFELKYLYLDKSKSIYSKESSDLLKFIRNLVRVACFVGASPFSNMPMWAHYANCHKGFCVEYAVKNSCYLYPVQYSPRREPVTNITDRIIFSMLEAIDNKQEELSQEAQQLIIWLFLTGTVKYDFWKDEEEYRILYFASKSAEKGELVPLQDLGLEAKHIYIGTSCNERNRQELIRAAKGINCLVSDTYIDETRSDFTLRFKPVN